MTRLNVTTNALYHTANDETVTLRELIDVCSTSAEVIFHSFRKSVPTLELDDLFQEVVLNLWKSFPRYRGDSKFSTWVYRVAMNTWITFLRRSSSRPQTVPMTANIAGQMVADEGTAAQLRELYRLINQLGKLERALILLWLEERSYQEMADILGISKANVAVKLNRIKGKLKQMSNS